MMADILFTHSYFLRFDPKEHRAMKPYPPLGTLYAAAYARNRGYSVALFDSMLAEAEAGLSRAIELHQPRVVVIYDDDFNYLTKMCLRRMRSAAFALAGVARNAGCAVIVHGSDPVDHVAEYLEHGADYVICGEGELTLAELLDRLLRSRGCSEAIRGLAFTDGGTMRRTPGRQVIRDLDSLPFPARDLLDVDLYRRSWTRRHGYFSINMVTTRGCPYHCNWCAKPVYGQVYNSRSPRNVVDEMLHVKNDIQPDHIWFCDDIFGLTPGWVEDFSAEVTARNASIPFKCLTRADLLLKENAIRFLRKSGCESVWIGAESGSQRILDAMEKGITVEQIREASRKLKDAGIRVGFFLQYGYPGEMEEDIRLTLEMVKDCRPDDIGISVSYPLPGTRFYETVKQQLSTKSNWIDSQDLDLMFAGTYVPDFYRTLHTVTHKKFRLWQGLAILKDVAVHPWHIDRERLRRLASAPYHLATLPRHTHRLTTLARQAPGTMRGNPRQP